MRHIEVCGLNRGGKIVNKLKYLNRLEDIRLTKEFIFLNPYKFIAFFIYSIILLIITVCLILGFAKKQETIDVNGSLLLSDKVQDIQIYVDGIISQINYSDNDYVEKGQEIIKLKSDKLDVQKQELQAKLDETQEQMSYVSRIEECIRSGKNTFENNDKEAYYYAKVDSYLTKVKALKSGTNSTDIEGLKKERAELSSLLSAVENNGNLNSNNANYYSFKSYKDKIIELNKKIDQLKKLIAASKNTTIPGTSNTPSGDTTTQQYQQQLEVLESEKQSYITETASTIKQQMNTLDRQIRQANSTTGDAAKKVNAEIENLKVQVLDEAAEQKKQLQTNQKECEESIKGLDADLNYYSVIANESGYIKFKGEIKNDMSISAGSSVGIITSSKDQQSAYYTMLMVKSDGIGFIQPNQNIKITVYGLDRKDYGFLNGKVEQIFYTPVTNNEQIYYQVKASVEVNENQTIYNDIFGLKDGMSIEASVITKETSWLYYLLDKMNVFKDKDEKDDKEDKNIESGE